MFSSSRNSTLALFLVAYYATSSSAIEIIDEKSATTTTSSTNSVTSSFDRAQNNYVIQQEKFLQFVETKRTSVDTDNHIVLPKVAEMRDAFLQWMDKFDKVYESIEEEFERMLIWIQHHEFIQTHNNKTPKPSFTLGHNQFSDMTNDEFQKRHFLGKYSPGVDVIRKAHHDNKLKYAMRKVDKYVQEERDQIKAEYRYLRRLAEKLDGSGDDSLFFDDKWFTDDADKKEDTDDQNDNSGDSDDKNGGGGDDPDDNQPDDNDTDGLPDEIDWVKAGAVTPVKNQGACGSCWAFSTTGSIEGAEFIKTGELVSLSEQNLIDCDTTDKGCMGGMMETAFKFDEAAKGLCSEDEYPYLASDGNTCNSNCTKVAGSIVADYHDIPEKDKHGLIASIALQPTSIAMQAGQLEFQLYSSGVFSSEDCGAQGDVDHGVLAVGYGTDAESGKKYFTVKNSWGADWGENGYFRLDRESNNEWGTCAILMIMTAPIMA